MITLLTALYEEGSRQEIYEWLARFLDKNAALRNELAVAVKERDEARTKLANEYKSQKIAWNTVAAHILNDSLMGLADTCRANARFAETKLHALADTQTTTPWDPATSPGMTDMMAPPETLDKWMGENPLSEGGGTDADYDPSRDM